MAHLRVFVTATVFGLAAYTAVLGLVRLARWMGWA